MRPPQASAQTSAPIPGSAEAIGTAGLEAFERGDYKTAVSQMERLIKTFPTDQRMIKAKLIAGYSYYLLGNYDSAIPLLKAATQLPATADIQEVAQAVLPQAMMAKAAALPATDPLRAAAFQNAIGEYNTYLKKFPGKDDTEVVRYGKAVGLFQLGKHDEAVALSRENINEFPKSRTIADSYYLLALGLSVQATKKLDAGPANQQAATALYAEAEKTLKGLMQGSMGIVVANDAHFQLGQITMGRATQLEGDEREAKLREALVHFRAVEPKVTVEKKQQAWVEQLTRARVAALQARNPDLVKSLQKQIEWEQGKLEQVKDRTDLVLGANIKAGEVFFLLGDLDAARVLMTDLKPRATTDDQKKSVLYITTMTYAMQNILDKATDGFKEFQSKYKNDPLADNMPIAIAGAFLNSPNPALRSPQRAIEYLDQAIKANPQGKFVPAATVQKATAQLALHKRDEALKTYLGFLQANPKAAPDVRAQAQMGAANIYRELRKFDDAIKAYQQVQTSYPTLTNFASDACYWQAFCLQQKGDVAGAIKQFDLYLKNYPEGKLVAEVMFTRAQALNNTGKKEEAIKQLAQLSEKFPDGKPGKISYFLRANIYATDKNVDGLVKVMEAFMAKYPDDPLTYAACESTAQSLINTGKPDEALKKYRDFADKHATNPNAPRALIKIAESQRNAALNESRSYSVLDDEGKKRWKERTDDSLKAAMDAVTKFPDNDAVAAALQQMLDTLKVRANGGLDDDQQVEKTFNDLTKKFEGNPKTKNKILFTLAAYVYPKSQARALELMARAYDPGLIYSARDLDLYGQALIESKNYEQAEKIYRKILADNPLPPHLDPKKAPAGTQEAQAITLYGLGTIAQKKNNLAEADRNFQQLRQLYPWSPKILEANYGIAAARKAEGKNDEAIQLLIPVIRSENGSPELRAKAMLMAGYIYKNKKDNELAIDSFIKIGALFQGVPDAAAEGLWEGGQLLEEQAKGITDPKLKDKRERQFKQTRRAYEDLLKDFPNSQYAPQARQRLSALPTR